MEDGPFLRNGRGRHAAASAAAPAVSAPQPEPSNALTMLPTAPARKATNKRSSDALNSGSAAAGSASSSSSKAKKKPRKSAPENGGAAAPSTSSARSSTRSQSVVPAAAASSLAGDGSLSSSALAALVQVAISSSSAQPSSLRRSSRGSSAAASQSNARTANHTSSVASAAAAPSPRESLAVVQHMLAVHASTPAARGSSASALPQLRDSSYARPLLKPARPAATGYPPDGFVAYQLRELERNAAAAAAAAASQAEPLLVTAELRPRPAAAATAAAGESTVVTAGGVAPAAAGALAVVGAAAQVATDVTAAAATAQVVADVSAPHVSQPKADGDHEEKQELSQSSGGALDVNLADSSSGQLAVPLSAPAAAAPQASTDASIIAGAVVASSGASPGMRDLFGAHLSALLSLDEAFEATDAGSAADVLVTRPEQVQRRKFAEGLMTAVKQQLRAKGITDADLMHVVQQLRATGALEHLSSGADQLCQRSSVPYAASPDVNSPDELMPSAADPAQRDELMELATSALPNVKARRSHLDFLQVEDWVDQLIGIALVCKQQRELEAAQKEDEEVERCGNALQPAGEAQRAQVSDVEQKKYDHDTYLNQMLEDEHRQLEAAQKKEDELVRRYIANPWPSMAEQMAARQIQQEKENAGLVAVETNDANQCDHRLPLNTSVVFVDLEAQPEADGWPEPQQADHPMASIQEEEPDASVDPVEQQEEAHSNVPASLGLEGTHVHLYSPPVSHSQTPEELISPRLPPWSPMPVYSFDGSLPSRHTAPSLRPADPAPGLEVKTEWMKYDLHVLLSEWGLESRGHKRVAAVLYSLLAEVPVRKLQPRYQEPPLPLQIDFTPLLELFSAAEMQLAEELHRLLSCMINALCIQFRTNSRSMYLKSLPEGIHQQTSLRMWKACAHISRQLKAVYFRGLDTPETSALLPTLEAINHSLHALVQQAEEAVQKQHTKKHASAQPASVLQAEKGVRQLWGTLVDDTRKMARAAPPGSERDVLFRNCRRAEESLTLVWQQLEYSLICVPAPDRLFSPAESTLLVYASCEPADDRPTPRRLCAELRHRGGARDFKAVTREQAVTDFAEQRHRMDAEEKARKLNLLDQNLSEAARVRREVAAAAASQQESADAAIEMPSAPELMSLPSDFLENGSAGASEASTVLVEEGAAQASGDGEISEVHRRDDERSQVEEMENHAAAVEPERAATPPAASEQTRVDAALPIASHPSVPQPELVPELDVASQHANAEAALSVTAPVVAHQSELLPASDAASQQVDAVLPVAAHAAVQQPELLPPANSIGADSAQASVAPTTIVQIGAVLTDIPPPDLIPPDQTPPKSKARKVKQLLQVGAARRTVSAQTSSVVHSAPPLLIPASRGAAVHATPAAPAPVPGGASTAAAAGGAASGAGRPKQGSDEDCRMIHSVLAEHQCKNTISRAELRRLLEEDDPRGNVVQRVRKTIEWWRRQGLSEPHPSWVHGYKPEPCTNAAAATRIAPTVAGTTAAATEAPSDPAMTAQLSPPAAEVARPSAAASFELFGDELVEITPVEDSEVAAAAAAAPENADPAAATVVPAAVASELASSPSSVSGEQEHEIPPSPTHIAAVAPAPEQLDLGPVAMEIDEPEVPARAKPPARDANSAQPPSDATAADGARGVADGVEAAVEQGPMLTAAVADVAAI